jgi:hypothetical protein
VIRSIRPLFEIRTSCLRPSHTLFVSKPCATRNLMKTKERGRSVG